MITSSNFFRPHFIKGPPLFTSKGYKFFHGFLISMCGHPYHKAECIDNATTRKSDKVCSVFFLGK